MKENNIILDDSQRDVINASVGYHLVLAPPGCGKTQILTERIRAAHAAGVAYCDMLCLTFTNRAARGMKERMESNIEDDGKSEVYVGNVHRFCSKFLFDNNVIPAETSVIDDADMISIVAQYLNDDEYAVAANYKRKREYDTVVWLSSMMYQIRHLHPKDLRMHADCINKDDLAAMQKICKVRNKTFNADAMLDIYDHTDFYEEDTRSEAYDIGEQQIITALLRKMSLAKRYEDYKKQNNLLDFEDLLIRTYDALSEDKDDKYKRYPWIQIDEVQDLNPMQLAIVDMITRKIDDVTVMYLGDEQQAIFSFMGAKMSTLELLKKRCEGNVHRLTQNHRSPKYLLDVFNKYAEKILNIDASLLPHTDYEPTRIGNELQLRGSNTVETEFKEVADIAGMLYQNDSEDTTAILVNSNADAEAVSMALDEKKLAYFKVSGEDLFDSPQIKILFAHLAVLDNDFNFIAWARLLKGIKVFQTNAAARSFVKYLRERGMTPSDLLNTSCLHGGKGDEAEPDGVNSYLSRFVSDYNHSEIVIFDTETTGLNVFEDDILQIAAVKICRGEVVPDSQFNIFLESDRQIPAMLGDVVNPIIEERKHEKIYSKSEALQMFVDYVGDDILLGHNADYDYNILKCNLQRASVSFQKTIGTKPYYDSLRLIKLIKPDLHQYKLKSLLMVLNLEGENAHLADADVEATRSLVVYCYEQAKLLIPSQQVLLAKPRMQQCVDTLRKNYMQQYQIAKSKLYDIPLLSGESEEEHSFLVKELLRFYDYLISEKVIKPLSHLDYITAYLDSDIINVTEESALIQQLQTHMMEMNTLKEADLCGSSVVNDRIFVSTVHKAKGLEFDNVIIFDAVEGRYPNFYGKDNPMQVAEDARKFYVAMSRAKKRLVVFWSTSRMDYHNIPQPKQITRFMTPILKFFSSRTSLARGKSGEAAIN